MGVKCFLIVDSGVTQIRLRRYQQGEGCPLPGKYHNAQSAEVGRKPHKVGAYICGGHVADYPKDDARWPKACACGYEFQDADEWQVFSEAIYRAEDGREFTLRDVPPGAMWDAWWGSEHWKGPDGKSMTVVCPDGTQWCIDARASNCTMPEDKVHRCWIRHGEPPNLTVDKNGVTCAAGAGSIAVPGYHGFLQNGSFT